MSDDQETEVTFDKHPALRNFNRTGFMVKHVIKGLLKWGAIGVVAGVAATIAMGVATAMSMGWVATPLVLLAGYIIPGVKDVGQGFALSTTGYLGAAGGIIGAAVGGIVALSGASEAADAEEDRLVAKYEQGEARRDRMAALERRRDEQRYAMEQQEYAMRGPGMQIPRGRPGGHQRLGNVPT